MVEMSLGSLCSFSEAVLERALVAQGPATQKLLDTFASLLFLFSFLKVVGFVLMIYLF